MFDKEVLSFPGARGVIAFLVCCALADAACCTCQASCLASCIAIAWEAGPSPGQVPLAAGFLFCYLLRKSLVVLRDRHMDAFAARAAATLRRDLLENVFARGPRLLAQRGSGALVTAALEDVARAESYLGLIMPKAIDLVVVCAGVAAALVATDRQSGIITIATLPFAIVYLRLIGMNARKRAAEQHDEYVRLSNHFADSLRGIDTLALFGQERAHADRIHRVSERFRKATMHLLRVAQLSSTFLDLFAIFALAAVSIMLGFRLLAGEIGLATALTAIMLVPECYAPVRRFAGDFHATLDGRTALAHIRSLIAEDAKDTAMEEPEPDGAQNLTIEFCDVSYTYSDAGAGAAGAGAGAADAGSGAGSAGADAGSGAGSDTGAGSSAGAGAAGAGSGAGSAGTIAGASPGSPTRDTAGPQLDATRPKAIAKNTAHAGFEALHKTSFNVKGPCLVGIVGMSGAGKSTLISLLAGSLRPTSGAVLVNGTRISLDGAWWRRRVACITQDPHLFHASMRDNLRLYVPDATDVEIKHVIRATGLSPLVESLPQGLDTVIGQGGRALSGGEAQRVALARALLDPERTVLLFDEPTAHLDIETEYELKQTMLPLFAGKLVFFATHRLHWMADVDQVIVFHAGRVAEAGAPGELALREGPYAQMVARLRMALR